MQSDNTTDAATPKPSGAVDELLRATERQLSMHEHNRRLERAYALLDIFNTFMPPRQPGELHSTDKRWQRAPLRIYALPGGEEGAAYLASEHAWQWVTGTRDRAIKRMRDAIRRPSGR